MQNKKCTSMKLILHRIHEIACILLDYTSNSYNIIPFLFRTKSNYHKKSNHFHNFNSFVVFVLYHYKQLKY